MSYRIFFEAAQGRAPAPTFADQLPGSDEKGHLLSGMSSDELLLILFQPKRKVMLCLFVEPDPPPALLIFKQVPHQTLS